MKKYNIMNSRFNQKGENLDEDLYAHQFKGKPKNVVRMNTIVYILQRHKKKSLYILQC